MLRMPGFIDHSLTFLGTFLVWKEEIEECF